MSYWTANAILNQTAVEVGLDPNQDPVGSQDPAYRQLKHLLDACGKELLHAYEWRDLTKTYEFTTDPESEGTYALPVDFSYMIPQTTWDKTTNIPVYGPLSPQDWTYLLGRGLVSSTIYVSFRLKQRKFDIFPPVPQTDKTLFYEYISEWWVTKAGDDDPTQEIVLQGTDIVVYPAILTIKMLKMKFYEAKGFDSSKAEADYDKLMGSTTGQDKSARILNAGNAGHGFPYLDPWRNAPDTGYGL